MSLFQKELANIKNPAYGSTLIYCLGRGYERSNDSRSSIPLPVVFLAVPLLLDREVISTIKQTRLGIRAVADKLSTNAKAGPDLLLSMPSRVASYRDFTVSCILVLLRTKLASLVLQRGTLTIHPNDSFENHANFPPETKEAEKLGGWLAQLSLFEISSVIKVAL